MWRRRAVTALVTAGLAGCMAFDGGEPPDDEDEAEPTEAAQADSEPDSNETDGSRDASTARSIAEYGFPSDICEADPIDDPGIYAIDEPATAGDWSGAQIADRYGTDGELTDDEVVLGVERDGRRRAYPLSVVWHHEAVNDTLGGPLLVTYCPLCRSAMVAERRVAERPTTFEVTGQLWKPPEIRTRTSEVDNRTVGAARTEDGRVDVRNTGNLVLVDRETGSYWSQILAKAICGPRTGDRLEPVPVTVTTWEDWRADGGDVLLPPPASGTV